MPDGEDDALREAAAHRGLKLVKSRKRKAGVGDYGRFGLTDASGKELFGFGPDGLTATPADIRDHLRKSEVSTWSQSAEVTPDRPKPSKAAPAVLAANDTDAIEDIPATAADSGDRGKRTRQVAKAGSRRKPASGGRRVVVGNPLSAEAAHSGAQPAPKPEPEPDPEPEPAPVLVIRSAAKTDLAAIKTLVGVQVSAAELGSRFNELKRAGGGVIVADRGAVIGCIAWQAVLGLQAGPIGRLTLLIVAEEARRTGIGCALVDAARLAMIDQGCEMIEAMSDIEVRNVNGFYRALGFAQKSYRFVSDAGLKG